MAYSAWRRLLSKLLARTKHNLHRNYPSLLSYFKCVRTMLAGELCNDNSVPPSWAGAPSVSIEISFQSGSLASLTNTVKALDITSTLVCPFNGKMISSSSMVIISSKTTPMKTHIVLHPLYQSNRQIGGKSTHTRQYLFSVAPHPQPFPHIAL